LLRKLSDDYPAFMIFYYEHSFEEYNDVASLLEVAGKVNSQVSYTS
jgi:hypothetical protein